MVQWFLASLHLLALGMGLSAVWTRGLALRGQLDQDRLRRVFLADAFWGVAAVLWISTGLLRAFGGFEKGSAYYLQNDAFLIKMAILGIILVLEVWPMATLIRWRLQLRQNEPLNTSVAPVMARISWVQAGLVIVMVFAATAMARGYGL